jgi:hypothetical protein
MDAPQRFSVFCECDDEDCTVEIELTLEEWDDAKSAPNRLIVVTGHPLGAGERVVAQTDRYEIAEGGTPPV